MLSLSVVRRLAVVLFVCALCPALAQSNVSLEAEGKVLCILEKPAFKETRKGRVKLIQSTVVIWYQDPFGRDVDTVSIDLEPGLKPDVQEGDVVCTSFNGSVQIVPCAPPVSEGGVS